MSTEPVTNTDVFLWAIFELGGAEAFVDVEDAFYRAFQLAPKRLGWRTRPDLPDLKKCSKALRDAEGRTPKLLVKNGPELRRLSVEGQQWIEDNFDRLVESLESNEAVAAPRARADTRLVLQALQSPVFKAWRDRGEIASERWQVAEMLRCSPDSARGVFRHRVEVLRAAANAAGRSEALEFVDALVRERSDWF